MIAYMPRRTGDAEPPPMTMSPEHFEGCYRETADPWNFRTSWYERRKYALAIASLPREHYDSGYEAGCSIVIRKTHSPSPGHFLCHDFPISRSP